MRERENTKVLWVDEACVFAREGDGNPDDYKGPVPWNLIPNTDEVTLGILESEHADNCTPAFRSEVGCDCGTKSFSTMACDGCGNPLHGAREAFTQWHGV